MKKIYGLSLFLSLFMMAPAVMAEETGHPETMEPKKTVSPEVEKKAHEKCEKKGLAGSLLDECVKEEIAKAETTKTETTKEGETSKTETSKPVKTY